MSQISLQVIKRHITAVNDFIHAVEVFPIQQQINVNLIDYTSVKNYVSAVIPAIESSCVLSRSKDPLSGWRKLNELLAH